MLPHWSPSVPGYSYILGMHAFGLEECNQYPQAEDAARRALALEPKDGWAVHAGAHVMEMQGRIDEGIAWLDVARAGLGARQRVRLPQLLAPGALLSRPAALRRRARALRHARCIRSRRSSRCSCWTRPPSSGASTWRAWTSGGGADALADNWAGRLETERGFYAFNDMHAMMAFAMAGREAEAARLVDDLEWTVRARRRAPTG